MCSRVVIIFALTEFMLGRAVILSILETLIAMRSSAVVPPHLRVMFLLLSFLCRNLVLDFFHYFWWLVDSSFTVKFLNFNLFFSLFFKVHIWCPPYLFLVWGVQCVFCCATRAGVVLYLRWQISAAVMEEPSGLVLHFFADKYGLWFCVAEIYNILSPSLLKQSVFGQFKYSFTIYAKFMWWALREPFCFAFASECLVLKVSVFRN